MKIDIKHEEIQKGIFKKTTWFQVNLTVVFSEEEEAIIKENNLERSVFLTLEPDLLDWPNGSDIPGVGEFAPFLFMREYNDPIPRHYTSKPDAQAYEEVMMEALRNLKAHLDAGTKELESKSVEL